MSALQRLKDGETIFWIITKDHIEDGEHEGYTLAPQEALKNPLIKELLINKFRLFDDDGELYLEGLSTNQNAESAFEPLDWATANFGCTNIKYLDPETNKWESL